MNSSTVVYRCPICATPLAKSARSLTCENRHCFDIAKEGYVNLLPVQNKKTLNPGDNAEMIQARKRFLSAGHYEIFAKSIRDIFLTNRSDDDSFLDLGCGEGYYTTFVRKHWSGQMFALDISKPAVRLAAKRDSSIHWSVASNFDTPFFDQRFDFILTVFAPSSEDEVKRLLKPGGLWLQANPGPNHLYELKELIYDNVNLHPTIAVPSGFERVKHELVTTNLDLSKQDDIADLLTMTPFFWSLNQQRQQAILQRQTLTTKLAFSFTLDQRV